MWVDIGGIALQHAEDLLLLGGIEKPIAVLVAVVGSLASEIIGQRDTEAVTAVAAVYLAVDMGKAASHHHLLCLLVVQAACFATCRWQHARPACMLFGCLKEGLVSQTLAFLLTVIAWTEGPPFGYFVEIDHELTRNPNCALPSPDPSPTPPWEGRGIAKGDGKGRICENVTQITLITQIYTTFVFEDYLCFACFRNPISTSSCCCRSNRSHSACRNRSGHSRSRNGGSRSGARHRCR